MIIGVPTEIKNNEFRVGLTPAAAHDYVAAGHTVYIQKNAGAGSSFPDSEYKAVGCQILETSDEVWAIAEMIIKVKEPIAEEYDKIREGQILYTYLHLAPDFPQTEALLKAKCVGIAYETVELPNGFLPLLAPMSEVAGRMASQVAAFYLQKTNGGRGVLMGGVAGVLPAKVLVLGAGNVGSCAAQVAVGMGADVTIVDINLARLKAIDEMWGSKIKTLYSSTGNIMEILGDCDIVVGAVLVPGARAPKIITKDMIKIMKPGSVLVDVAIDQGGCIETSHITTHADPVYYVDDVLHYGVANMPGAVPNTSTRALNNATLRYGLQIANKGWVQACKDDAALAKGVNVVNGEVVYEDVAKAHGMSYTPLEKYLV